MNVDFETEHELLKEKAGKKTLKIGIGFALSIILTEIIIYFSNGYNNTTVLALPKFIFIAGIITSTLVYRKTLKGIAFFGEIFSNGFKTTALQLIFVVVWIFLSIQIFPEIKEIDVELARKSLLANNYNETELNNALEAYKSNQVYYLGKIYNLLRIDFILGILTTVVLGMFLRARSND